MLVFLYTLFHFILTTSFTEVETELLARGYTTSMYQHESPDFRILQCFSECEELILRGASLWAASYSLEPRKKLRGLLPFLEPLANFLPSRVGRCFPRRLLGPLETKYGSSIVGFLRDCYRHFTLMSFLKAGSHFWSHEDKRDQSSSGLFCMGASRLFQH